MNLKPFYSVLLKIFVLLTFGLAVQGCGLIYDSYHEDDEVDGNFHLKVRILTSKEILSRANHSDDEQLKGSNAENYIDFDSGNFKIILFNIDGTHLLDIDRSSWEVSTSEDSYYVYYILDINVVLPEGTTEDVKNRIKREGIKVMALANWNKSADDNAYASFNKSENARQTLSEIWEDGSNYNFVYSAAVDDKSAYTSWLPTLGENKKLIPMFGISTSSPFSQSTSGAEYRTSVVVPMQRVLAKVEVIDNVSTASDGSITNVSMSSFNELGRFIPNVALNPNWDKIGSQVEVSSLPANVFTNNNELEFVKQGNKWIAYVPEMALGNQLNEQRPHINVDIEGSERHVVHFAYYNDQSEPTIPDESWNHILRNHIYRYEVSRGSVRTNIHLHVIPWTLDEDEVWDFTDHASVVTYEWENHDIYNKQTGEIYLSFDQSIDGHFQVMSPINGRWYIRLVPLGDAKPGAVSFVDAYGHIMEPYVGDPPYCHELTGDIIGPVGTVVHIAATDIGNDQESRFRLEFYVENLGRWTEVSLTKDTPVANYIIIRKANLIQ